MGSFSNKIVAEFTPPKTWMLKDEMAFLEDSLTEEDIETLKIIGANITDVGRITCIPGMKTDLASVPRIAWILVAPWDIARAAIIHDHLYAKLRTYWTEPDCSENNWKNGKDLADKIFLLGMKSADPKVPSWKMYPAYWAVRLFGRWSAK